MLSYETIPDRPAEFGNGITTQYRGFEISDRFVISKNGKVIPFGECWSLQQAKITIDQSLAAWDKLHDKQASLRKLNGSCELEDGQQRREYEENQINNYFDTQLYDERESS